MRLAACTTLVAVFAGVGWAQPAADAGAGEALFNIFVGSTPAGFERVRVVRADDDDGWLVQASGQMTAPVPTDTRVFEAAYDSDWRPRRLTLEGSRAGVPFRLESTFADGAVNERSAGRRPGDHDRRSHRSGGGPAAQLDLRQLRGAGRPPGNVAAGRRAADLRASARLPDGAGRRGRHPAHRDCRTDHRSADLPHHVHRPQSAARSRGVDRRERPAVADQPALRLAGGRPPRHRVGLGTVDHRSTTPRQRARTGPGGRVQPGNHGDHPGGRGPAARRPLAGGGAGARYRAGRPGRERFRRARLPPARLGPRRQRIRRRALRQAGLRAERRPGRIGDARRLRPGRARDGAASAAARRCRP